jgi:hypothetical protein
MRTSAIRTLTAAQRAPIIAAARFERSVQIWDVDTGQHISEFDTVFDYGGNRLALDPDGKVCVAASWKKGKRGRVAAYDTQSGRVLWQRPERGSPGLRFSSNGAAIWYRVGCHGPVWQLDSRTGETLTVLRNVEQVFDSPFASHHVEARRDTFLLKSATEFRLPRLTFAVLDATFSPNAFCVSESRGPVRCINCVSGDERWRYVPPSGSHVVRLFYSEGDHCFFGVEWPYEYGGPAVLVRRISQETGSSTEVCRLDSFPFDWCSHADVVVSALGDVASLKGGTISKRLAFPQCGTQTDQHPNSTSRCW